MLLKQTQLTGETVGVFRILEPIGHGAMASVYHAFDEENQRDVALKIPDLRLASRADFANRFVREARAMALLQHTGIVQIYSVSEYEGVPMLAMQYVRGGSLANLLAQRGKLLLDEAVGHMLHMCKAVEYAHSQGIIHRDLKPSNILLEDGCPLIADFGISKILTAGADEETFTFVGTPLYISPEQCGEGVLDLRTDIYSLGAILYEMLLGKPPFKGESPAEIIRSHLLETPKFPRNEENPLPPKIVKIIRKMLAKDPRQRHSSAGEVAADLLSCTKEGPAAPAKEAGNRKLPSVLCHVSQRMLLGAVTSALHSITCSYEIIPRVNELVDRLYDQTIDAVILGGEAYDTSIYRTAERIRKESKNPKLQVLMVSAGISKEEVQKAFGSGVHHIVAEPYNPSVLVAKLENVLHGGARTIESRRFFRVPFTGKATMRIESEVLDISEGGMRILSNIALKAGELITFELDQFRLLGLGEKSGKVVWVSGNDSPDSYSYQAGIDFVDLTDTERSRLRRWLMELQAAARSPR